jgi:phosphatidylglycerol:prolipoprotein diacylglycerol transferase
MHPVLAKIGPITIHYYGLMYVIAFAVGFVLLTKEVRRKEIPLSTEGLLDLLLWTVPTAIIGARLYYVAFQWDYYGSHPVDIIKIWQGGLAIHGGVLAGVLTVYLFARAKRILFWALTDALVPSLILGQAIGRIGNLMNGDAFGTPTSLPWGIRFPLSSPAGAAFPGEATHPAMIYEMLLNLMIFVYLWAIRKRGHKNGFSTAMYFVLYAIARSVVSFTRGDSLWLGPIRAAHVISGIFVVAFGGLIWIRRLYVRSPTGGTPLPDTPAARVDP